MARVAREQWHSKYEWSSNTSRGVKTWITELESGHRVVVDQEGPRLLGAVIKNAEGARVVNVETLSYASKTRTEDWKQIEAVIDNFVSLSE